MERKAFRQRMQQYKQARESNPQLKYWDWKKYADGTDGVNDFITEQIKQKIQQAFDKSKTRTMPSVPLIGGTKNPQTPEQFDLERSKALQKYQKEIQSIESQGIYNFTTGQKDIPLHLQRQYEVAKKSYDTWNNMVYQPTVGGAIGPSCIYTATDNYGSQYLQPSNVAFMNQPASISGFTKIDNSNVQPGDIVIRTDGNNNHAMIYAGRDARGPIYNHSNGGQEASDYRKNAHYPATNEQLSTYRFTGTHNDSIQWKKQYKAYADGGEVGEEEKQYLRNWFNARKQYANLHQHASMNRQLKAIDRNLTTDDYSKSKYLQTANPYYAKGLDIVPITINNSKVKQIDRNAKGYYHRNEGIVMSDDYKDKDRELLLHEASHVLNSTNTPIQQQIIDITKGAQIFDKGSYLNEYLTRPDEIHSRLMEFRKLNNLDPLKTYGIPDIKRLRTNGKDADILNLFPDDNVVLDLLNNVAFNKKDNIQKVANGGEVRDNTYVAPIYKEQVFIPATGAQKIKNDYQYKYGSKSPYKGGELEIVSPEFDILTGAKAAYDTTVGLINNLSRTNRTRKIVNSFKKNLKTSDKLDVLKDNPEFGQIGTPFDYSNYIDDIFKDSQLKGIYYHGGPKGIEKFRAPKDPEFVLNKAINSGAEEQGIYFTGDKGLANYYKSSNKNGKVYKVKLNSQNPYYTNDWFAVRIRSALDKDYVYPGSITDRVRSGILKDHDAVVWHGRLGENIVFDPDQIHILGSKKDMQLFNDYIKNKHSYKNGGTIDEDPPQTTSERPIINFDSKGDPYNPVYGYNPGAGYTKSAFDLYDAPIIGDALSVYDATEAAKNKQWLSAGLAALGVLPFVPRVGNKTIRKIDNYFAEEAYEAALKKSSRPNISVPTVEGYRKSLDQQLNRITSTPDLSTLEREADWNNLINREIEKIYDPEVRKRAAKIDKDRGTTLQYYYDDLHRNYTENYDKMPKARLVDNIEGGAKAQMTLTQEARERLKKDGGTPSWGDFEMRVDRSTPLDPEVAQHEIAHFNQYMNNGSSDLNRLPYGTGKQHMRKDNPVLTKEDPVGYYDNIGEQGAYQLNIINEMLKKKIPVTQKNYINFVKKLPTSSSKRKAVEQFNTYKDAYNWTKMMPLTGVAGITWLNYNKEE